MFDLMPRARSLVGNLLGEGDSRQAKSTTWLVLGISVTVLVLVVIIELACKSVVGRVFTDDAAVIDWVAMCVPFLGLLQLFDGLQVS